MKLSKETIETMRNIVKLYDENKREYRIINEEMSFMDRFKVSQKIGFIQDIDIGKRALFINGKCKGVENLEQMRNRLSTV